MRLLGEEKKIVMKPCNLRQFWESRHSFWLICKDLILMTGFRNPAPAKRGHERGFQKMWLRKYHHPKDKIKKLVWCLTC